MSRIDSTSKALEWTEDETDQEFEGKGSVCDSGWMGFIGRRLCDNRLKRQRRRGSLKVISDGMVFVGRVDLFGVCVYKDVGRWQWGSLRRDYVEHRKSLSSVQNTWIGFGVWIEWVLAMVAGFC